MNQSTDWRIGMTFGPLSRSQYHPARPDPTETKAPHYRPA